MIKKNNIDVVVISCDAYSDIWPYFFKYFNLFWGNCPLDIYLISNIKKYNFKNLKNIQVGEDISWSENLLKGLESIKKEYVLLMIDDLLLNRSVSNSQFGIISEWIDKNKPLYLRLHNSKLLNKNDNLVSLIPQKTPYKTSTMPSIWKKSYLEKILKKGESAWEFEIHGSKRAFSRINFFTINKSLLFYDNSIIKGKWQKGIAKKLNISSNIRPIMNQREQYIYNYKRLRSKIFNFLPNYFRLKLKGFSL